MKQDEESLSFDEQHAEVLKLVKKNLEKIERVLLDVIQKTNDIEKRIK